MKNTYIFENFNGKKFSKLNDKVVDGSIFIECSFNHINPGTEIFKGRKNLIFIWCGLQNACIPPGSLTYACKRTIEITFIDPYDLMKGFKGAPKRIHFPELSKHTYYTILADDTLIDKALWRVHMSEINEARTYMNKPIRKIIL